MNFPDSFLYLILVLFLFMFIKTRKKGSIMDDIIELISKRNKKTKEVTGLLFK